MGLDTSHGAWNGPYSSFMAWRRKIAEYCGLGDIMEFEGYVGSRPFSDIKDEGIRILLSHSDCDGILTPDECIKVATSLNFLLAGPINIDIFFEEKTEKFINGCLLASSRNEDLLFH